MSIIYSQVSLGNVCIRDKSKIFSPFLSYLNKIHDKIYKTRWFFMRITKQAFTMIEIVFVLVVLGILAAVAVPKFTQNKADATIAKGRADVASIRSAIISERQSRLIKGVNNYIPLGTGTYTANAVSYKQINNGGLFGGILMYPIAASTGNDGWSSTNRALGVYMYKVADSNNTFTYTPANGLFLCTSGAECSDLVD